MKASIIIRTLNEARHLPKLLTAIRKQATSGLDVEVIVVDSGSTDRTVSIAKEAGARLVFIDKAEFSFGRSLNRGCEAAQGDYLIFVSGHCIPVDEHWLAKLVQPIRDVVAAYTYGRQIGNETSQFSERQIFKKYYPEESRIPQTDGFFVNNANAALRRDVWKKLRFDEDLLGLEDMDMAKRVVGSGHRLAYVADATVYHLHRERWAQVRRRYEREAIALQGIMPEVHVHFADFVRYYASALLLDAGAAMQERTLARSTKEIVAFRLMQFWGSYRGNHEHRKLSRKTKEKYFYPK
ncbi:MAG: glycosyltransferase [Deltaproteobacteria bacterium]|nr:glycosyltransferase [Deltaproteobacteria bacterium]